MTSSLAPIVLFVHSRAEHTAKTLDALAANTLASESHLFIYSDAARHAEESDKVADVRKLIDGIQGFRSVTVVRRDRNYGLAKNIIDGVSEVSGKFGKVIVLEDDVVTSRNFLRFMNDALSRYESEKDVWHISGWNYPITAKHDGEQAFLWRLMNCWGWATWSDRWSYFKKDPDRLVESWSSEKIRRFNLDGIHDSWEQVVANQQGRINTWAIFWYATIFENDGLCLNPYKSYVRNIGLDGTGCHCGDDDGFDVELSDEMVTCWPSVISENQEAVTLVKQLYSVTKISFLSRVFRKLRSYLTSFHKSA